MSRAQVTLNLCLKRKKWPHFLFCPPATCTTRIDFFYFWVEFLKYPKMSNKIKKRSSVFTLAQSKSNRVGIPDYHSGWLSQVGEIWRAWEFDNEALLKACVGQSWFKLVFHFYQPCKYLFITDAVSQWYLITHISQLATLQNEAYYENLISQHIVYRLKSVGALEMKFVAPIPEQRIWNRF